MTHTPYTRLLSALYKDGISEIRTQKSGNSLPSLRVLTTEFFSNENIVDSEHSVALSAWGQLSAHDLHLSMFQNGPSCCTDDSKPLNKEFNNCLAIVIPANDLFYSASHTECLNIKRLVNTENINCSIKPAIPINNNTAALDASFVYGSTAETNKLIREFKDGRLRVENINGRDFPPNMKNSGNRCAKNSKICMLTGDVRGNQQPLIQSLQVLFLRLHNWMVGNLKKINTHWDDEKLYQKGRLIISAIVQHITYRHYLPIILGKQYMDSFGLATVSEGYNNVYDSSLDIQISTEFVACAYRSLHSMILDEYELLDYTHSVVGTWTLSDTYDDTSIILQGDHFDQVIMGMTHQPMGKMDLNFPMSTSNLLLQKNGVGSDLAATDIGRGRDTGLKSYPHFINMVGLGYPESWEDLEETMDRDIVKRLRLFYDTVDDVDPFLGGMLENQVEGTMFGPTFLAIISEQYYLLQRGDRHYYELGDQPHSFTLEQLREIRKVTLATVFCLCGDNIQLMQQDVFRTISEDNPLTRCTEIIGDFSLKPWARK
ncbi:peroxidase-like [Adelges cooleyi]|uniref:peroxidase-like n=1 Tax=Adelges cooleyi TaxID=133065 RepID=UPI00217FE51C|nr:peroxidase-like [Adelges cooleyi]